MPAKCRGCGAEIVWGLNRSTGKMIPFDNVPAPNGQWELAQKIPTKEVVAKHLSREEAVGRENLYVVHFATCPKGPQFRRVQKIERERAARSEP